MFHNREDAGKQLARRLSHFRGTNPLVLGIPRGAATMAKIIADSLEGEFDLVLVHKLGAPGNPEYAIGAISESNDLTIAKYASQTGATENYLETEREKQLQTLQKRRKLYTPHRPPIDPSNRIVIIVDDGIATGSTMIAALQVIQKRKPTKLIAAVPVAPPDSRNKLEKYADEVICLETPVDFFAVGQFYRDFSQVSDQEVIQLLKRT